MAQLIITSRTGEQKAVDPGTGLTVMEIVRDAGADEPFALCGGVCSCATCHVYVDPDWTGKTGERNTMEESMLDFADNVEPNSRLSCQIKITEELDGLVVRMPESQY